MVVQQNYTIVEKRSYTRIVKHDFIQEYKPLMSK